MSLERPPSRIELREPGNESSVVETDAHSVSLAPADGGWEAWLFLLGSFLIEMLIWGKSST